MNTIEELGGIPIRAIVLAGILGGCDGSQSALSHPSPTTMPRADPSSVASTTTAADGGPSKFQIAFDAESRDASWATEAEHLIQDAVKLIPTAFLKSVECRATICQVVVEHTDDRAIMYWHQKFPVALMKVHFPQNRTSIGAVHDPADNRTVAYITKSGWILVGEKTEPHGEPEAPSQKEAPVPNP